MQRREPGAGDAPPVNSRRTLQAGLWVAFYHGGQALVAIGVLIALARILDPHDFAVAAVAFSVVSLFTPIAEGFFNDVILQRRGLGAGDLSSAWLGSIALGAMLWLALWALAHPIAVLVGLPEVADLLPWMAITLLIGGCMGVPAAFARRRGRYKALAAFVVPGRLLGAAVGIGAALLGFGAWSVMAQHLTSTACYTVLVLAGAGIRLRPRLFTAGRLRELTRFSLASLTDILILPAYSRLATPLVSALLGPAATAYWNIALRIVEMLYGMVYSAAAHLTLPMLARQQHDKAAIRSGFMACTGVASLMVLPVFAGMAVTAPELVLVLLGPSWLPAAPLVTIFSLTAILLFIRQFVIVAITALGRPGHSTRISAQGLGLGLAGLAAGAPFGLPVAAAASALRALPLYVPGAALMRRTSGMGALDQLRPVARPLLATALMALLVLALRHGLVAAGLSPPIVLAGCVAAGAIAYALAVAALARAPLALLLGSAGFGRRRIAPATAEGASLR